MKSGSLRAGGSWWTVRWEWLEAGMADGAGTLAATRGRGSRQMADQTSAEALNAPLPQRHMTRPLSLHFSSQKRHLFCWTPLIYYSKRASLSLCLPHPFFFINHRSGSCLMLLHFWWLETSLVKQNRVYTSFSKQNLHIALRLACLKTQP